MCWYSLNSIQLNLASLPISDLNLARWFAEPFANFRLNFAKSTDAPADSPAMALAAKVWHRNHLNLYSKSTSQRGFKQTFWIDESLMAIKLVWYRRHFDHQSLMASQFKMKCIKCDSFSIIPKFGIRSSKSEIQKSEWTIFNELCHSDPRWMVQSTSRTWRVYTSVPKLLIQKSLLKSGIRNYSVELKNDELLKRAVYRKETVFYSFIEWTSFLGIIYRSPSNCVGWRLLWITFDLFRITGRSLPQQE